MAVTFLKIQLRLIAVKQLVYCMLASTMTLAEAINITETRHEWKMSVFRMILLLDCKNSATQHNSKMPIPVKNYVCIT